MIAPHDETIPRQSDWARGKDHRFARLFRRFEDWWTTDDIVAVHDDRYNITAINGPLFDTLGTDRQNAVCRRFGTVTYVTSTGDIVTQ